VRGGILGFILGQAYTSVRLQQGRVELDADLDEAADVSLWKYVRLRRLTIFVERSLGQGLQWAVFEPNAEPAWARVRGQVGDFLRCLWREGRLAGATP